MMKNFLHLLIALGAMTALAACGAIPTGDDDDSSVSDDDDFSDDDDSAAGDDDDDSSAGDDDDSAVEPDPVMELDVVEIACVDEVEGRDLTTTWTVTVEVFGWLENPVFFMWDQVPFEGHHFIDSNQPWIDGWDNTDFGSDGAYDVWEITFEAHDNISDAEATDGTILRCYDSGGNLQIEEFNYMVCATDFFYGTEGCAFIGYDFGEAAGTTANPVGTVGAYDDGAGNTWTADLNVTPDDKDAPVIFSESNPD
ncbi:MAG: hypothetical protein GY898_16745 [Proteobacteria bacterium]|nr:hypothetical protein [Pseudomonadota bacterium]